MPANRVLQLDEVSRSLLIPLAIRARESRRPDALLRDPKAQEVVDRLGIDVSSMPHPPREQVSFLLRMREFDRRARAFLAEHPDGVLVDLGCGLDTRFERTDNGRAEWFGVDLPRVIELRRELLGEPERCHLVAASLLELSWMDALARVEGRPVLFLAEAVLVYLEEGDVRRLVQALAARFPGSELVCEAYSPVVVRYHPRAPLVPRPRWALRDDRDVEAWAPGIRLVGRCDYVAQPEPRLGAFRFMRFLPFISRVVRVVHYRLGP